MKITLDLSCEKCGYKWEQTAQEKDEAVTVVAECPHCKDNKKQNG